MFAMLLALPVRRRRFPTRKGGTTKSLPPTAQAQEWGRRQAARSPKWDRDKWRRVATVFGVEISDEISDATPESGERGAA